MPNWLMICLIPLALLIILALFVGFILAKDTAEDLFNDFLQNHGRKTKGVITESEQYTGHGLHDADPCFRGRFEFEDHRGKRYQGKFSRYCFEPYDFANSEYSFESAKEAYCKGAIIDVYYLSWLPFIHIESIRLRKTESLNREDETAC